MSMRILLTALGLVVAVGALSVGALVLLGGDDPAPAPTPGGDVTAAGEPGDAPTTSEVSARERTQIRHDYPWPFEEFSEDIAALRRPKRSEAFMRRDQIEEQLGIELSKPRISLRLDNATVEDVIAELTREFAKHDLKVYTRDPPVDNDPVFERFYMTDASVWDVIQSMRVRTNDLVTYAITPAGLCIGSNYACQNARIDATRWEEEQVGEGDPEEEFAFLGDARYRPDFREAHIGAVVRDILEQSGVQVVVGPDVWSAPVKLTWRHDPMPVYGALRQIAIKSGAALYAKDDRVFLLDR